MDTHRGSARTRRSTLLQITAACAAIAALAGCAHGNDRLIIAGVPAQVDSKFHDSYYDTVVNLWQDDYTVTLEQCDFDIRYAQSTGGLAQPPHYDKAAGSIGEDCFAVTYHVGARTYAKYEVGSEVTFEGTPANVVKRIG